MVDRDQAVEIHSLNASKHSVPVGYKQTEVGMIPEDWKVIDFGDLFETQFSKKEIKANELVSFVGMQDVSENAQLINYWTVPYSQLKTGLTYFERGDVLVAKITPCFENGKGCLSDKITEEIGYGSTEFHVLRAHEKSDSKFIYYITTKNKFRFDLQSEMVGSAGHRRVPLSAIHAYKIPCPLTKEEQTAIANALSDVDSLLNELEKLIAKKQAIKTATMQQLLTGKTRLPQFASCKDGTTKSYKTSELGEIPEDWTVAPFNSFLKIKHGRNQKLVESLDGQYPIFASGGQIGRANSFLYDKPSVLIGRKGTIDKPRYLNEPFWTVDTLFYSEISESVNEKFIFYKFCMVDWMKYNEASGVPSLNTSTIESVLAAFPERKEQTAIVTILSDMDEEIQSLRQRLDKTRQIKQGMMQELLTGKTRLVKPTQQRN
ncbi:hypothetical protein BB987_04325 [Photorhabdus temperata]|uniref:Restriction endonuclease S subunit n=1 Tax=Photorhabdus khanii NC19 TaxID=1004151 RepID=W3V764_9GAMM|nr:restriction endonuclease subunit S [Photorhabdus khanii]ETS31682.1 restriction endonuclease S subunit [Photorhabdus khanii NC19]OHV58883.1 hypothetical protein BB987_04325 [Photorhabdus temperata]